MANVTVVGYLRTNKNEDIPLRVDSQAEGSEFSLTTDTSLTTTAQDVGTYMEGAVVSSLEVFAPNGISYVYILRQGVILAWGIPNVAGVSNQEVPLSQPVQLRAGDTVRCLALASSSRNAALCVTTASGVSRIFVGTPSGSGTTDLNDLQNSANSIGDTLQGQILTRALLTTVDGSKVVSSGGCWIRNSSGQLAGVVQASNPIKADPDISMVNIPIGLNWTASIVTNA